MAIPGDSKVSSSKRIPVSGIKPGTINMRLSAIATLFFALLAIAAPLDESIGSNASPNIPDEEARCRRHELDECLEVRLTYSGPLVAENLQPNIFGRIVADAAGEIDAEQYVHPETMEPLRSSQLNPMDRSQP